MGYPLLHRTALRRLIVCLKVSTAPACVSRPLINNKLRSRYRIVGLTVEANYRQSRSIARPLCKSWASCMTCTMQCPGQTKCACTVRTPINSRILENIPLLRIKILLFSILVYLLVCQCLKVNILSQHRLLFRLFITRRFEADLTADMRWGPSFNFCRATSCITRPMPLCGVYPSARSSVSIRVCVLYRNE